MDAPLVSLLVPLMLTTKVGEDFKILYSNRSCNSSISCRPVRLSFEKESHDTSQREIKRLAEEIKKVENMTYELQELPGVTFRFKIHYTMNDGKMCVEITLPDGMFYYF